MILFSICNLEDKANHEEWQTDSLRERQVCIFSLALMIFATPLCVSVEAWLTHTLTHTHSKTMRAPCNICTSSEKLRPATGTYRHIP